MRILMYLFNKVYEVTYKQDIVQLCKIVEYKKKKKRKISVGRGLDCRPERSMILFTYPQTYSQNNEDYN